jgi:hypothetical protein
MMKTTWAEGFPKLYELYSKSDQADEANYFTAFDKTLNIPLARFRYERLEGDLMQLDDVAWQEFQQKALKYVAKKDRRRGYNQLFECFNEITGFLYLKTEGCENIHFIPEAKVTSPDLKAGYRNSTVLLEVKTINKSEAEIEWIIANSQLCGSRMRAGEAIQGLGNSLKLKIADKISEAKHQLLNYPSDGVKRRIVYLVINMDILSALDPRNYDDLAVYVHTQDNTQIEVQYSCK